MQGGGIKKSSFFRKHLDGTIQYFSFLLLNWICLVDGSSFFIFWCTFLTRRIFPALILVDVPLTDARCMCILEYYRVLHIPMICQRFKQEALTWFFLRILWHIRCAQQCTKKADWLDGQPQMPFLKSAYLHSSLSRPQGILNATKKCTQKIALIKKCWTESFYNFQLLNSMFFLWKYTVGVLLVNFCLYSSKK